MAKLDLTITKKQNQFRIADAFEVLFGGAAGGGKSHGQLIDALLYALNYPKSSQIIFRSTFADLEKSLIRKSRDIYPQSITSYNDSKHTWKFKNGSIIDFGYIQYEKDVYQYQSAEYDVIRFDELTHFTEFMYTYMISRCRGANNYPKHIKSSTNPGGIGHVWVKKRFIDIGEANKVHTCKLDTGEEVTRIFIPSLVTDNKFITENDPDYVKRLDALPEKERKALKDGDWDIYDGQYFSEFNRKVHVTEPFEIPRNWDRYISFDYGLDKFAVLFIAIDTKGKAYVYNEIHKEGLIVSEAAQMLKSVMRKAEYKAIYAPPDLWQTDRHTGKSTAEIFRDNGITLTMASNKRVAGWLAVKEWLKIKTQRNQHTGENELVSDLVIFNTILKLIEYLPQIQYDEKNVNDCANEPHELTHICDALRYFCVSRISPSKELKARQDSIESFFEPKEEHYDYGEEIVVV
ncbi:MAG: terminase family protein [Bacillota bacterium]|nr:terminase family protein [Bacillota bacterium]